MEKVKVGDWKNKKWFFLGVAIVLAAVAVAAAMISLRVPVETEIVGRGEVVRLIKESGTVESANTVTVTAKNSFTADSVSVTEGQSVKAGDILMTNDAGSVWLDIKSMKSQLSAMQAQYNGMNNNTQLEIKSMEAQLSGLQIQYDQARSLADKNKRLYEAGALSYEEYNQMETAAALLAEQVSSLGYSIKSYTSSAGTAAKQLAAQISAQKYAIQSYTEANSSSEITAPISGVITGAFVKTGENVLPGSPLFEISDLNDIYINVDLIAEDAEVVRVGDQARVYNKDTGLSDTKCTVRKIDTKVEEIMSELGINQKRVAVEVKFGSAAKIRLGTDVDVEITVEKKANVLRIPELAIFEKDKIDYVYMVENGRAVMREVKTGIEGEDFTEVVSGLTEGDLVILSPGSEIEDGTGVRIVDC